MARPKNEEETVQKHVRLSPELLKKAEKKAKESGFRFPEYVRHLIAIDTKDVKAD